MSAQPVPKVNSSDVDRVVRRDFPGENATAAHRILDQYGNDSWHGEVDRVRLAALKLAAGNLKRLEAEIETARADYRDVLVYAEYPEYFSRVSNDGTESPTEVQRIIDADWQQYQEWLARA